MVAPLLCYHFTALCTSKGDISDSAIRYLWRFFSLLYRYLVHYYICMPAVLHRYNNLEHRLLLCNLRKTLGWFLLLVGKKKYVYFTYVSIYIYFRTVLIYVSKDVIVLDLSFTLFKSPFYNYYVCTRNVD